MSNVRVREHVNPLSSSHQRLTPPPPWSEIYRDVSLPLHLDLGCGKGGYLLTMARHNPHQNFLGLEIRRPLVARACQERDAAGLTNLHYAYCNVNVSLAHWKLRAIAVSILFPDPWFKRRQQKRRTVQPQLVEDLAHILVPGGRVYLQSDVEPLAIAMVRTFLNHPAYRNLAAPELFLGDAYPDHVPTEREQSVRERGLPVYQTVLVCDGLEPLPSAQGRKFFLFPKEGRAPDNMLNTPTSPAL